MATLTWEGGRDLSALIRAAEARRAYLIEQVELAIKLSIEDGAVMLQNLLEAAVTKTGLERELSGEGGFPGRHRTGNMVGSISYNEDALEYDGAITWGSFGWFQGQFEAYFEQQDLGEGNIPAAHAMMGAMDFAIARYQDRLQMVVDDVPVR